MPYGDDITEGLPYVLSNASVNPTYTATGESYDISLNGLPFFLAAIDEFPYTRQTAPYRKQQIDQTNEPGEQTLTGWWTRSQSSFHNGTGIKFYDPSVGESVAYRVNDCKGVDIWTKGQVTLLNTSTAGHVITGAIASNGRPFQFSRSIQWSTSKGILLLDEYDVDKIFPTITVSISNKALTSNVATLTTTAAHGLSIGMQITISGVDATFNGEYRITTIPTGDTAVDVTLDAVLA